MDSNPTIPVGYDIAFVVVMALWAILTVVSIVSVFRAEHDRSGAKFWWPALIIALPLLGASAWFLSTDRRDGVRRRRS